MTRFTPRLHQNYFMVNSRLEVKQSTFNGSNKGKARIAAGNCFQTMPEAELFLEQIQDKVPITRWEHFKKAIGV